MSFPPDTSNWTKRDFLLFAEEINIVLRKQVVFGLSDEKKILVSVVKDDATKISRIIKTSSLTKGVRQQLQELVDNCLYKATAIASPSDSWKQSKANLIIRGFKMKTQNIKSTEDDNIKADRIVSRNIIRAIRKGANKMTYKKIGEMIGCSESYISRVANGERAFTLEHLTLLEKKLNKPVPLLLLEATNIEDVAPDMKPLYKYMSELMDGATPTEIKERAKKGTAKKAS
jgi:transcriptional regulator with XRE-family HTH domain